ncbi:hypothetical protein TNCT_92951 [Trichonephila clavata]|uniref:Uncharacterized protein n=1 Tax=Trichonephila clavata TaxID=2740835 RepID=A0A8X6G9I9_TRICU|nr:hypothetical protein TNCT_92951 [Trichonephila clavata]
MTDSSVLTGRYFFYFFFTGCRDFSAIGGWCQSYKVWVTKRPARVRRAREKTSIPGCGRRVPCRGANRWGYCGLKDSKTPVRGVSAVETASARGGIYWSLSY